MSDVESLTYEAMLDLAGPELSAYAVAKSDVDAASRVVMGAFLLPRRCARRRSFRLLADLGNAIATLLADLDRDDPGAHEFGCAGIQVEEWEPGGHWDTVRSLVGSLIAIEDELLASVAALMVAVGFLNLLLDEDPPPVEVCERSEPPPELAIPTGPRCPHGPPTGTSALFSAAVLVSAA